MSPIISSGEYVLLDTSKFYTRIGSKASSGTQVRECERQLNLAVSGTCEAHFTNRSTGGNMRFIAFQSWLLLNVPLIPTMVRKRDGNDEHVVAFKDPNQRERRR
jgi:hypothetical protein